MSSCDELASRFLETLNSYLRANGSRLLSIALASKQSEVKLSTYGLIRYYSPLPNYPKFSDLLMGLINCGFEEYLGRYGFSIAGVEGVEIYIKVPLEYVKKYLGSS